NLIDAGVTTQSDLDGLQSRVDEVILNAYRKAIDLSVSPRADQKNVHCALETAMFSNARVEKLAEGKPQLNHAPADNPRVQQLAKRSRSGLDETGQPRTNQRA